MAKHQDQKSQGKEVINQYIKAIDICIKTKIDGSGNILGYPAANLLFSVLDAMSSYNKEKQLNWCCLDILENDPFNLELKNIYEIKKWYRHKLTHSGSMVSGVSLTTGTRDIFDFNNGELVNINIEKLFEEVKSKWHNEIEELFDPTIQSMNSNFNNPLKSSHFLDASSTPPTSGFASPPVSGVCKS